MNIAALPLLFNGLFFSISPSAVHNCTPGKEVAVLKYNVPACEYPMQVNDKIVNTHGTCSKQKVVKVLVNFIMNDKKELQVNITVNGSVPGMNDKIIENINLLMPQVRNYISANKPYSITLELSCCDQVS